MSTLTLPTIDFTAIGPRMGDRFPDIVLPDQRGQKVDLHEARDGRRALVVFYRSADWCPYCKSQLVSLQRQYGAFDAADVRVFGISYDPVEVLSSFTERHGIAFPLLSDEGSATIRRLGLLNVHAKEQQAYFGKPATDRHTNAPYPGIFVLDEQGVVVDKHFEQTPYLRQAPSVLATGPLADVRTPVALAAEVHRPELAIRAWLDAEAYVPTQRMRLHLTVDVAEGLHVYRSPLPDGYQPLAVTLGGSEHLAVDPPELPEGEPFRLESLDEDFTVLHDRFPVSVPFTVSDDAGPVELRIDIAYQTCSDVDCQPPSEMSLVLPLRSSGFVE